MRMAQWCLVLGSTNACFRSMVSLLVRKGICGARACTQKHARPRAGQHDQGGCACKHREEQVHMHARRQEAAQAEQPTASHPERSVKLTRRRGGAARLDCTNALLQREQRLIDLRALCTGSSKCMPPLRTDARGRPRQARPSPSCVLLEIDASSVSAPRSFPARSIRHSRPALPLTRALTAPVPPLGSGRAAAWAVGGTDVQETCGPRSCYR